MKIVFITLALLLAVGCGKNNTKAGVAGVGSGPDKKGPALGGGASDSGGGGATGGGALIPLAVGNEWTYELSGEGTINWCPIGVRSSKITAVETKGGEQLFTSEGGVCGTTPAKIQLSSQGDKYWSHGMGQKFQILDTPVDGGKYNIAANEYQWKRIGNVGSFSDCWRATLLTGVQTSYSEYCRGAGMVTYYIKDVQGNSVTAKLVKKNF